MKKLTGFMLVLAVVFSSCKKETLSKTPAMDNVDLATSNVKYTGTFANGPFGSTSGSAKILTDSNNNFSLVLDSFMVNAGPDLHVYLSKEIQPLNFIDLGKLRAVSGTQVYAIPGSPDFTTYKFALIHCQQYDHLFGNANLQ